MREGIGQNDVERKPSARWNIEEGGGITGPKKDPKLSVAEREK